MHGKVRAQPVVVLKQPLPMALVVVVHTNPLPLILGKQALVEVGTVRVVVMVVIQEVLLAGQVAELLEILN